MSGNGDVADARRVREPQRRDSSIDRNLGTLPTWLDVGAIERVGYSAVMIAEASRRFMDTGPSGVYC